MTWRACKATNADGDPCKAVAIKGSEFCYWHDPASAAAVAEARKKGGTKSVKMTPDTRRRFIELIQNGNTIQSTCEALNVAPSTYRYTRMKNKPFAGAVDRAKEWRVHLVEDALFMTALSGQVTAMIFWLTNRASDQWRSMVHQSANVDVTSLGQGLTPTTMTVVAPAGTILETE